MIIGIDFGGVLSVDDTLVSSPHRNTAVDMRGAKEALAELSKDHKLFLISFCGKRRAMETKASIVEAGLDKYFTGLYFVKHPDYKAQLTRYLGCNVMIDDTVYVLDNIRVHNDKIHTILFNPIKLSITHSFAKNWETVELILYNSEYRHIECDETIDITRLCYAV
jgi:hypothetical protein